MKIKNRSMEQKFIQKTVFYLNKIKVLRYVIEVCNLMFNTNLKLGAKIFFMVSYTSFFNK